MQAARGPAIALVLFAAAFALHVAGGAADQAWLFALAVVAISLLAAGFPLVAVALGQPGGARQRALTLAISLPTGAALTAGTLWAANDRAWAWWTLPVAAGLAAATTALAARLSRDSGPA